jgi:phage-related minor tail protein
VIDVETYGRAYAEAFDQGNQMVEKQKSLVEELGLTFTSAFEDAVLNGGKLSDVLKGLEQDILRIIMRKAVTEPMGNAIGSIFSGIDFGSIFASANGNAFTGAPALSAYSGSVVSRPTVFPFANGIGLMGEAGAEAILPLRRGADGKLGVAGGGGAMVQINVNNTAPGTQATATSREEGGVQMIDIMVEQVEGKISRNLSAGRGIAPAMERRYGLNAAAGSY